MAPVVLTGSLPFHPVYVAVAIGCGSKPGMWMNDSGFWVVGRMRFTRAWTRASKKRPDSSSYGW